MHLQDQQSGAMIDAYKAAGYFDNQPGQPNSSMLPSALQAAANKGPLGTKTAVAGVINNYLQMNYQMQLAKQKYMLEQGIGQGGFHQGGGGGPQPQPQSQPQSQPGQSFDLKSGPTTGMNQNPWNPTGSSDEAN